MPERLNTPSLWEEYDDLDVADVVADVDAPDLQPTYSYIVPEGLSASICLGSCVHVPFGGQEKVGFVFGRRRLPASDPLASRLREIIGVVEGAITFDAEQAETARWIADRYVCDLIDAARCIAPAVLTSRVKTMVRLAGPEIEPDDAGKSVVQAHILATLKRLGGEAERESLRTAANHSAFTGGYSALLRKRLILETRSLGRAQTVARTVRAYTLGSAADTLSGRNSPAGERILAALAEFERRGETPVVPEKLLSASQASSAALKTLLDKGAVVVREMPHRRAPTPIPTIRTNAPAFTLGQLAAAKWIARVLVEGERGRGGEGEKRPNDPTTQRPSTSTSTTADPTNQRPNDPTTALLFGVTASGKTEVYLDAIARTLSAGRGAIVLLPEIALTAQVVDIFTGRFGDEVAVLHSKLSDGERHDEWRRLQDRKARIAVGARSAIFAPVNDVGLIVVDEEHEPSYKQESQPRYNARDVAIERARLSGATVLLGSATPSLETYYACEQGRIHRLEIRERIDNRPLPAVELIDMRIELKEQKSLFSRHLQERLAETIAAGRQAILFLNRRGYSQFVLCRECGYVARCPNCAVSLAFHAAYNALRCHHCDYARAAPTVCPTCGGARIRGFGVGTERVEEEVLKLFPDARVARLDRDTTARKGAHAGIIGRFRKGEANVLIGTQMVAKGLDFPNVTLVGVISADTSINMPDFRAGERTFQLLTQVAGRAGRGVTPGEVAIQTFCPEHYSLQMAVGQDYPGFYAKEIAFREELRYPPFSRFANLVCNAESAPEARERAHTLAASFRETLPKDVDLIGPAAAPLSKLKRTYRWHVVLRAPLDAPLSDLARGALSRLPAADRRRIVVDIDPMSMA